MAELFTGIDFMEILTGIKECLPVVLPVVIGCLAFRKGLSFVLSMVKRA